MKKINLLELCLSPDLGGLELYVSRCAEALTSEMNIISVINPIGKLKSYYASTALPYFLLRRRSIPLVWFSAKKLAAIIDQNEIDVIHVHWTKDLALAVLAKLLSRKKPRLIQTRHMMMTRFKNDFFHRWVYRHIDAMIAITHQVSEQLKRFIPSDIRPTIEVIHLGVDALTPLDDRGRNQIRETLGMDQKFAVGMLGRINDAKGQGLLIDALELIKEKSDIEVYFVGHEMQQGYIQTLMDKAKSLRIEERIHFLGFMKNPKHFLQASDVVVMGSKCETFGLVTIEAMHAKTAVIGADQCGVLEIIDDGINGLLFQSQNYEDLAEKIALLYDDPKLRAELAKAGYEKALMQFESKKHFEEMKRCIRELVE